MTPLLRPLMGIPGICGLALVASLQSTDTGASMTKEPRTFVKSKNFRKFSWFCNSPEKKTIARTKEI